MGEKRESEKATERTLAEEVRKIGGLALKFVSPNMRGVPDRVCIFPTGKIVFVEVKSEGIKVPTHQHRTHMHMRNAGAEVRVIDTKEQVFKLIGEYNV